MQGLALHVTPRYRWDDLILPPIKEQLQDLVDTWLNRNRFSPLGRK